MKIVYYLFTVSLLVSTVKAQDKTYFNAKWEQVKDPGQATYYRSVEPVGEKFQAS